MPAPFAWIFIALGVAILFSLAVFVHEWGHYWVARKAGLKIDGFSIGFGPRIFGWTDKHGVEWALRWLPLGGFVRLPQMVTAEALEGRSDASVTPISPGIKIAVAIAGPLMNIAFAFLLATVVWWVGLPVALNHTIIGYVPADGVESTLNIREGDRILTVDGRKVRNWEDIQTTAALALTNVLQVSIQHVDGRKGTYAIPTEYYESIKLKFLRFGPRDHPAVKSINPDSPALAAGLKEGDEMISFEGIPLVGQRQLVDMIQSRPGQESVLEVSRAGQRLQIRVTPYLDPKDNVGRIGVMLGSSERLTYTVQRPGPTPWDQVSGTVTRMGDFLQAIVHPRQSGVGVENLNGPVRIFTMLAMEMRVDLRRALALMVVLNVNLAILNLLPLPVLDGGHITLAVLELITRRKVPPKLYEAVTIAFTVVLISFMLFVTFNDVRGLGPVRSIMKQDTVVQPAPAPAPVPAPVPAP